MKNAENLTNRTIIDSEIPPDHASKREIEEGLRSALVGLPGEWRIVVVCSRTSVWWVLRVEGPRFKWMTVLPDPTRQNAPEMTGRLLTGLHDSDVLS